MQFNFELDLQHILIIYQILHIQLYLKTCQCLPLLRISNSIEISANCATFGSTKTTADISIANSTISCRCERPKIDKDITCFVYGYLCYIRNQ